MGRIRKALSITSVIATGGAIGTPVKWESPAEKAAREQKKLMQEQNDLLAQFARQGQRPAAAPRPVARSSSCAAWSASIEAATSPWATSDGRATSQLVSLHDSPRVTRLPSSLGRQRPAGRVDQFAIPVGREFQPVVAVLVRVARSRRGAKAQGCLTLCRELEGSLDGTAVRGHNGLDAS